MGKIEGWFDACAEPVNPGGHIGWGALLKVDGAVVWTGSGYVPASWETSNNYGEFLAVVSLFKEVRERIYNGLRGTLMIRGDSKLVIMQLLKKWKVHGGLYVPMYQEAIRLLADIRESIGGKVELEWIPREQNGLADVLSKAELHKRGIVFRIQPEPAPRMESENATH